MSKDIRLYVKSSDLLEVANGSKLLRCHADISKWDSEDLVFITGQEHRRIMAFVKEEMIASASKGFENHLRKSCGLPLLKIKELRELDISFEAP